MAIPFFYKCTITIIHLLIISKILLLFFSGVKCSFNIINENIIYSSTVSLLTKTRMSGSSMIKEEEFIVFSDIFQSHLSHFKMDTSVLSKLIGSKGERFSCSTSFQVIEIFKHYRIHSLFSSPLMVSKSNIM
jgi:hypothetical protein